MRRAKGMVGVLIIFLCLGVSQLISKYDKVRFHDFVQIAASGAMCGVAIAGIVVIIVVGRLRPADRKPHQEQPPPPEKTLRA